MATWTDLGEYGECYRATVEMFTETIPTMLDGVNRFQKESEKIMDNADCLKKSHGIGVKAKSRIEDDSYQLNDTAATDLNDLLAIDQNILSMGDQVWAQYEGCLETLKAEMDVTLNYVSDEIQDMLHSERPAKEIISSLDDIDKKMKYFINTRIDENIKEIQDIVKGVMRFCDEMDTVFTNLRNKDNELIPQLELTHPEWITLKDPQLFRPINEPQAYLDNLDLLLS